MSRGVECVTFDPPLLSFRAAAAKRACPASRGAIVSHPQALLLDRRAVAQSLSGRAAIDVGVGIVDEVRLHVEPMRPAPGGVRPRHRRGDALLVAGQQLGSAEVALVGEDMQVVALEGCLGFARHRGELVAIVTLIGDLVRHHQVGLRVDHALDVVPDMPAVLRARRHGTGIRVGQRYLPVRRRLELPAQPHQPIHFHPNTMGALGQMRDLLRQRRTGLLPIGTVRLLDVAADLLLQMRQAAGDLRQREVPIAIVDRLELAAVHRHAGALQHADPAAKLHKLGADSLYGLPVVAPEIGDGLVVGHQASGQPHQFDVASRLPLQPAAGRDPVEIAVDEQLEQDRGVIPWPACRRRSMTMEAEGREIEFIDEEINDADQVILADPVLQTLGEERGLIPMHSLDETRHPAPSVFVEV